MPKKIEFVPVTDPESLKETLEEMVNNGWRIKGFVSFENKKPYVETFAVLQRLIPEESAMKEQESYANDEPVEETSYAEIKKNNDISISVG